jgi:hypothetical protein
MPLKTRIKPPLIQPEGRARKLLRGAMIGGSAADNRVLWWVRTSPHALVFGNVPRPNHSSAKADASGHPTHKSSSHTARSRHQFDALPRLAATAQAIAHTANDPVVAAFLLHRTKNLQVHEPAFTLRFASWRDLR